MRGYNIEDYIGKKFNKLTVVKDLKKLDKHNSKMALFKCDCGKTVEFAFSLVKNGYSKTCGCNAGKINTNAKIKKDVKLLEKFSKSKRNTKKW